MACGSIDYTNVSCPSGQTLQYRLGSSAVWQNSPIPYPTGSSSDQICVRCICDDDNSVVSSESCIDINPGPACDPCFECDSNCDCVPITCPQCETCGVDGTCTPIPNDCPDPATIACGEVPTSPSGCFTCDPGTMCEASCFSCNGMPDGCIDNCPDGFECSTFQDACVCIIPDGTPCEVDGDPCTIGEYQNCNCVETPCQILFNTDICRTPAGEVVITVNYNSDCPGTVGVSSDLPSCVGVNNGSNYTITLNPVCANALGGVVTFTLTNGCVTETVNVTYPALPAGEPSGLPMC